MSHRTNKNDILYVYRVEVELIKSVIDLAASRRVPINVEFDEWLSFESITKALKDICEQLQVDTQVEHHCYETLLLMSAESEKHLTWWEKISWIERYLPKHSHRAKGSSIHSPSNVKHHHQQASMSHRALPTPDPYLMTLVAPEKSVHVRPSVIPSTSPGTLLESTNLSMLLNDTYGFQTKHDLNHTSRSSAVEAGLYVRRNMTTQDVHTSRGNISFANTTTPVRSKETPYDENDRGWMSHIGPSSSARRAHFQDNDTPESSHRLPHMHHSQQETSDTVDYLMSSMLEKVSTMEKDVRSAEGIIAGMYGKKSNEPTNAGEHTPPHKQGHSMHHRGDWTLSPSVIHNVADTPMVQSRPAPKLSAPNLHAPAASAPLPPTHHHTDTKNTTFTSTQENTYHAARTKSRTFSDLLRNSGAMSKYMNVVSSPRSPRRAQSSSPTRRPLEPTPPAHDDSDLGRVSAQRGRSGARHSAPADTTPEPSHSRKKVLFDSPTFSPPAHHRSHHTNGNSGMHDGAPTTPRSAFAARHPVTPSRVVPLALQGFQGGGGFYTPEGHIDINALDFDARVLHDHSAYAKDGGTSSDLSMIHSEGLVDTITSSTRILIIFHRWLLRRSDHNNVHFDDERNAALMLICHFERMNNFVTSLFGLEQWLRDKMKLIVRTEAKAYVFRTWNLKYGVSSKSREFWRRRRLHFGFESFLEYGMKRRMHRKNALHALAARRRHANSAHMAPILRHKPARPTASSSSGNNTSHVVSMNFDGSLSDHEHESDYLHTDSTVLSPQLSRLSDLDKLNKYSNLDMSMLDMEKRHRAKQAQYFTSLSIRDIIHDHKSALLMYSRGGTNAYNLRAKTEEYVQAQDAVALLFAFRRFYHRAIYITRQRKIRLLIRKQRLFACMSVWKIMYAERAKTEEALRPQVEFALQEMKLTKKRIAFRKLHRFVHYSQRDKARLARFSSRIRSKQIYVRALHSMRCVAYVKCFDVLKANYIRNSPTVEELRHSAFHQKHFSVFSAFRNWRRWLKTCTTSRLNSYQSESSRQLLMATLLQRSHIRHLVQSGSGSRGSVSSMSTDTFFALPAIREMRLKPSMLSHTVHLTQLKRAMRRFKKLGRCARVFFSLADLRNAQSLGRRNVASERLRCTQWVNDNSCRVLPSARDPASSERDRAVLVGQARNRRSGAEKPYKLVGVNPHTLKLFLRTIYNSTPLERHESDYSFARSGRSVHHGNHKSLLLMNGTKLSATPQLLRMMRTWRVRCNEQSHLRKLCEKVRHSRALAILKAHYDDWKEAFKQERLCNRCDKRRALLRWRAFRLRNRTAHKMRKRGKRDLVIRHWQRLAAAHMHHTELRRLQAGHFYNSVLDGSSRRVLDFIAKHDFVPFSVRHFLSHFPSYRFPIYRQYDEAYWDHARHTDAFQALLLISQHHQAYTHDRHVTHHLELFQHHHHQQFQPASSARRNSDPSAEPSRSSQPHSYATPSHHSTFVHNSKLYQSPNRPLHLTPGAMLSEQAFSVSAAIASSKYGRGGTSPSRSRGRSVSPNKGPAQKLSLSTSFEATNNESFTPYRNPAHSSSYQQRARAEGETPTASELASAAMFMSHWISECLQQYYTLRRALRLFRHFGRAAGQRTRKLRAIAESKQRLALAALWQNRQDRKLTKAVRAVRLREYSLKLRATTVYLRMRKNIFRKIVEYMCQTHRHNLIVRTWQNRWNNVVRSAWTKLVDHTKLRTDQLTRIHARQNKNIQMETVRVMCSVVTANMWRRRNAKVTGLRNLVKYYNKSVLAMDRENTVVLHATIKHFAIFKENMLGKLKQRLSDVVGMNFRRKNALIAGFMALFSGVQQPRRQILEEVLRDRMYGFIDGLRENHSSYVAHQFRPGSDPHDIPLVHIRREHRRYHHQQIMNELRDSTSPYVSTVLPMPSPLPPAHTISTTVRRASMLRDASREHITIDTLSENRPRTGDGGRSVDTATTGGMSPRRGSPRGGSAAQILFGSVGPARSPYPVPGSALDDFSVLTGTLGPSTRASSGTLSAMAQRRRSTSHSAFAPGSDPVGEGRNSAGASRSGNFSPFSVGGRRSVTSLAPSSYGPTSGFRNSVENSRVGFSLGSTFNTTMSNLSNFSLSTRRSTLHESHAAVLHSPTNARPAPETDRDPFDVSLQLPSSLRPQSILITSPAYVGSARSRGDSRIFFSGTSPTSGPASVASAREGRRSSASVQQQTSFSTHGSRRYSAPPSSHSRQDRGTSVPPFSPLTPRDARDQSRDEGNFFDDASDAASILTTETPRGSFTRVQRRRSSVHQQRNEESVEQVLQIERVQKLYIFRRWFGELQAKKNMQKYCDQFNLQQSVRIHFRRLRRQTRIDRHQRLQLNRVAARRTLSALTEYCAKKEEHHQIVEFAEKYYLVMALKLNLRKWRSRVKRRVRSRWDALNAKTFNKRRAFMKFLINLRAICTQLPLPGENSMNFEASGRYGSPARSRKNFSATEWKHSPAASRASHRALGNTHNNSMRRSSISRHASPPAASKSYSADRRAVSPHGAGHYSHHDSSRAGYREHKPHAHVHYADEEVALDRSFRSAGALTKRSIASILK